MPTQTHASAHINSDIEKIKKLVSALTLMADGSNLSDLQRDLVLQAAEGLNSVDLCCLEWVISAAEKIAPII